MKKFLKLDQLLHYAIGNLKLKIPFAYFSDQILSSFMK